MRAAFGLVERRALLAGARRVFLNGSPGLEFPGYRPPPNAEFVGALVPARKALAAVSLVRRRAMTRTHRLATPGRRRCGSPARQHIARTAGVLQA